MKLSRLLSVVRPLSLEQTQADPEVEALSEDSRDIVPNTLFFARRGTKRSGLDFVQEAVQKGAVAIISEEKLAAEVPVIQVDSILEVQSKIADEFYGHPSQKLTIVGVTGTNGKTTFTYLIEAIAREMNWRTGVVGTINYRVPKMDSLETELYPAPNTTPNALELQKILAVMVERKTDLVIMEVSSHALALGRVDKVEFDAAVFTNLTQDHLDFHKTLENYFEAKALLFRNLSVKPKAGAQGKAASGKFAIINLDDNYGQRLIPLCAVPVKGYAIQSDAEWRAEEVSLTASGSEFKLCSRTEKSPVHLHLIGQHNIYNALAATAVSAELKVPFPKIIAGLENTRFIPGRLEPVDCGQDFTVLVDYAHTEDALKNVLIAIRQFVKKRVLTLFGCGGDRDRSKRPLMGALAVNLSDWVIVTSDNPRSEDPQRIALDIEVGIQRTGKKNFEVLIDREQAVEKILKMAQKDDVVLLAGKGHETYQIFADKTIHFDDREVARKVLSKI